MIADADANKADDLEKKAVIDARNKLDAIIAQADKFITENDTVDTTELKITVESGKEVIKDAEGNTDKLTQATEKITEAFQAVSAKMYENSQDIEQPDSAQANADDIDADIIDAEIED